MQPPAIQSLDRPVQSFLAQRTQQDSSFEATGAALGDEGEALQPSTSSLMPATTPGDA